MNERRQIVLRESEKLAFELREAYMGKKMKVLIEDEKEGFGHTENFLPVICPFPVKRNTIVEVECIQKHAGRPHRKI